MIRIKVIDTIDITLDKVRNTLFDVFYDIKNEYIYFTNGLDVGQIKYEGGELCLGLVLKDSSVQNLFKGESFPTARLDDVIDKSYYDLKNEKFEDNATKWLKKNGNVQRVSNT